MIKELIYPPNFTREELLFSSTAIRRGLSNEPASTSIEENIIKTAWKLQELRDLINENYFHSPITVLSCYRSPAVNAAVGGRPSSAHMSGSAVDIRAKGFTPLQLATLIKDEFKYDQIILEFNSWVHWGMDFGGGRSELLTAVKQNGKTKYLAGLR